MPAPVLINALKIRMAEKPRGFRKLLARAGTVLLLTDHSVGGGKTTCSRWRDGARAITSGYSRKPGFTETRLRPLARRRDNTLAPLLVFIRERKPCFFTRLRRLGWNVRFGMKLEHS